MLKKEIIKLIKIYNETIDRSQLLNYKYITLEDKHEYMQYFDNKRKDFQYYNIDDETKKQILILNEEIEDAKKTVDLNKKILSNSTCNHKIVLQEVIDGLIPTINYSCCICGKKINEIENKNDYLIFPGTYTDEDYGTINLFNLNIIHNLILNYLKEKKDDENIDLYKELKEIKYNSLDINDPRNIYRNRILIIAGQNNIKLDNNTFIESKNKISVKEIYDSVFKKIPNLYTNIIELNQSSEKNIEDYNVDYKRCKNFYELEKLLNLEKNNNYDIIIDMTNFIDYEITNSNIKIINKKIDLNNLFKGKNIISLSLDKNNKKQIYLQLKQILQCIDIEYNEKKIKILI